MNRYSHLNIKGKLEINNLELIEKVELSLSNINLSNTKKGNLNIDNLKEECKPDENELEVDSDHYLVIIPLLIKNEFSKYVENIKSTSRVHLLLKGELPYCEKLQDLDDNFSFKKYVKQKTNELWNIKKKNINRIRLYKNINSYHIYFVILDNTKNIPNYGIYSNQLDKVNYYWKLYIIVHPPNITNMENYYKDNISNFSVKFKVVKDINLDISDFLTK